MTQTKTRQTENFPVGSLLIPKDLRTDVHAYYRFARRADDIADSPIIEATEKMARLTGMEQVFRSKANPSKAPTTALQEDLDSANHLKDHIESRGLDFNLATDLLEAFKHDALNKPCRTWGDLLNYCRFSACPVGRFLIALHGEEIDTASSDALCSALQITNHIQDAKQDWVSLKRLYIPNDWMTKDGTSANDLKKPSITAGLRTTLDRMLDHTDILLERALKLPTVLRHRGLATEAAICIKLARQLSYRLRHNDPISTKVSLTKRDWMLAGGAGIKRFLRL
ncbi:MAG: squalene/phytoene synthase family protein [Rhodospirillaceae bacterium]